MELASFRWVYAVIANVCYYHSSCQSVKDSDFVINVEVAINLGLDSDFDISPHIFRRLPKRIRMKLSHLDPDFSDDGNGSVDEEQYERM